MSPGKTIKNNYERVLSKVCEAATKAGRDPDDICVVAVTKYVSDEWVRPLVDAGCRDFGESRPQHLQSKAKALASQSGIRWHMIGHLQRNKVSRTVQQATLIQSVDSLRLIKAIDEAISNGEFKTQQDVLLEVNISGDAGKHGFQPSECSQLLDSVSAYPNVRVKGLMAMASLHGGRDAAQRNFADVRKLRDSLIGNCPEQVELTQLSMGMSRDFDIAIEEGATIVRVGSVLYEGCDI